MSSLAHELLELNALPLPHGALIDHLLRAFAARLIADGLRVTASGSA